MKKILPQVGILLLFLGIYAIYNLDNKEKESAKLDKSNHLNAVVQGPEPCKWDVKTPERVLSENKTQAIFIKTENPALEECQSDIFLRAPGFDVSPLKESQNVSLAAKGEGSISWILSPKKPGSYEIAVSDEIDTKIFGISVVNMFGLSALQAKILSFLGTVFGPMLTFPWWWDRIKKRKPETKSEN